MKFTTLTALLDEMYRRTYVPTAIFDEHEQLCFPKYSPFITLKKEFSYLFQEDDAPIHIVNTYQLLGASFYYNIEGKRYRIMMGPCTMLNSFSDLKQFSFDVSLYVSSESLESFKEYCRMLYVFLEHKEIEEHGIPVQFVRAHKQSHSQEEVMEDNLYERRSHDATRDSYQFELRFLDYVKHGRKDKIDWIFSKIHKTYEVKLASDSLEGTKLKFASTVTLLTRCAIDCGVPLDSAFALSDSLIQGLKDIHDVEACMRYLKYASYEFADIIHTRTHTCSPFINQCLQYIDAHLYEKISLQDLADITNHSSVYISSQFKKEIGESITNYILHRKIEEAKQLLLFTDHSYQEISTLLNFTSQSHFTQRFKQITNQTPKSFRNKNFQYL